MAAVAGGAHLPEEMDSPASAHTQSVVAAAPRSCGGLLGDTKPAPLSAVLFLNLIPSPPAKMPDWWKKEVDKPKGIHYNSICRRQAA